VSDVVASGRCSAAPASSAAGSRREFAPGVASSKISSDVSAQGVVRAWARARAAVTACAARPHRAAASMVARGGAQKAARGATAVDGQQQEANGLSASA
jgi:hypothetical protein